MVNMAGNSNDLNAFLVSNRKESCDVDVMNASGGQDVYNHKEKDIWIVD